MGVALPLPSGGLPAVARVARDPPCWLAPFLFAAGIPRVSATLSRWGRAG